MTNNKKTSEIKPFIALLPFFVFATVTTWLVSDHIFFWDTVQLGAQHATFFYKNNFSGILLPDSFDSGHIPAFGIYIAFCWKLFGRSLLVSHFAMLPFIFGIIWQSHLLLKKFISPKYIYFALTLFLLDPTLLGQAVLVSPDVVLVFLFLLALNAVLLQKKVLTSIAVAGLALVSMRGMMAAFAILVSDLLFSLKIESFKSTILQLLKKAVIYSPVLILFLGYNIYHYYKKGWIGYHEESPWAECFQMVDFKGLLYNIGILGWRILDFGRVFLWIIFIAIGIIYFKTIKNDVSARKLLLIFIVTLATLSVSFILYKNLSGHRYILPAILAFSMLTSYFIFEVISSEKLKYLFFSLLAIGLITGNLWVYPQGIAQGWDASLAHLPYYSLRDKMNSHMRDEGLQTGEVASFFPNKSKLKYLDLSATETAHTSFSSESTYVVYSNIYNDVSDEEYLNLEENFLVMKEFKKRGIFIRLYKKKPDVD